jgi:pyrimidine-nucleoside phosphorylase/thymidine phosphorylase
LIQKKRDGETLSDEEIRFLVSGLVDGSIPEYQVSAFLMAVYFQGMTPEETATYTRAMLESGERYDFSDLPGPKVDKHSTGGIGDKVSMILAPLAAACGLVVPMMAGRGLGHTGGTLDKLEAIPGFDVRIPKEKFREALRTNGCAIIGQSEKVAPADRKLYALRDVTGTVESLPLICGSILSKKLAEGTEALILDVKVGSGAFMKSRDQARKLARALIATGKKSGLRCRALLTNMDQPLGCAVGNAIEMVECIEMLKSGTGPADLKEVTIQLCALMLEAGGVVRNVAAGRKLALERLADGSAWAKFQKLVEFQGGSLRPIHDPSLFARAPNVVEWKAPKRGYVVKMNCEEIGRMVVDIGGGRKKTTDAVDPAVGFYFHKKLGSKVAAGETLVTAHLPAGADFAALEKRFHAAVQIGSQRKPVPKLVIETI